MTSAAARGHCCLSLGPVAAAAFRSVYRPGCPSLLGKNAQVGTGKYEVRRETRGRMWENAPMQAENVVVAVAHLFKTLADSSGTHNNKRLQTSRTDKSGQSAKKRRTELKEILKTTQLSPFVLPEG